MKPSANMVADVVETLAERKELLRGICQSLNIAYHDDEICKATLFMHILNNAKCEQAIRVGSVVLTSKQARCLAGGYNE